MLLKKALKDFIIHKLSAENCQENKKHYKKTSERYQNLSKKATIWLRTL